MPLTASHQITSGTQGDSGLARVVEGLDAAVIAVDRGGVVRLANRTADLLRMRGATLDLPPLEPVNVTMRTDWLGTTYGDPTPASTRAVGTVDSGASRMTTAPPSGPPSSARRTGEDSRSQKSSHVEVSTTKVGSALDTRGSYHMPTGRTGVDRHR